MYSWIYIGVSLFWETTIWGMGFRLLGLRVLEFKSLMHRATRTRQSHLAGDPPKTLSIYHIYIYIFSIHHIYIYT